MFANIAFDEIDSQRAMLEDVAKQIWDNPEIYGNETFACELYTRILKQNGFAIEEGVAGLPTAFRASWGNGHPVIGFLGEYDALPGMSQKICTHKEPVVEGANGHACGHNLVGVGCLGAVLGLKKEMEENHLPGTLVFYGCPAEEKLIGKIFMARGGCFQELDTAFSYHPGRYNGVFMRDMLAVNSVYFHFSGKTAHAGLDAYSGRSALDAVEIMNVGANYLREHVRPDVRFHYIITHGGDAPNVVPDKASSWYLIRAKTREGVEDVYNRLIKVAKGAAHMTETQVEVALESACYPTIYNEEISKVMQDSLQEVAPEPWTEEEKAFAHALNETTPKEWEEACNKWKCPQGTDLYEGILPYETGEFFGSTDVGDVSYICPTTLLYTACVNVSAPTHSWQATACVGRSIGFKGAIYGAKVMAHTALKMIHDPAILQRAQEEFQRRTGGKPYVCPVPDDVPVYQAKK